METPYKLKELLEKDPATQGLILEAVRENIKHYQYNPQSIPFELFQNADDAVIELAEMMGDDPLEPDATRFVVSWDKRKISFIHWGRPINQFRYGSTEWRGLGYDRDLEKMLVLSYSDKLVEAETREEPITGKFGLGFKSVFLVTDSPRVISGRLRFKIVGGIYPQLLLPEEVDNLRGQLEVFSSSPRAQTQGTIIELPLADEIEPEKEILESFFDLVHVLLVFSRRIKRCDFEQGQSVFWQEKPVLNTLGVYTGVLQPATGSKGTRALVLRSEKKGQASALLLSLDSRGFSRLADTVPTIWVTAPTLQKLDLGFAVNGPFDLDVGRAQLAANSARNKKLARSIGKDIGEALCQLFQAARSDWEAFCQALNLAADVKPYELWDSFWELLVGRFSQAADSDTMKLLCEMLWGDTRARRGVAKLITERRALPTRLWSEYQTLTRLGEVRFAVKGVLRDEPVFNVVSRWPSLAQKVELGTVVSNSVKQTIDKLLPTALECEALSLCKVLDWELDSSDNVDPTTAQRLGELITRQWLSELEPSEKESLGERLKTMHFRGRDGKYHPARELLIAQDDAVEDDERDDEYERQDEQKRARFAPSDRILDDDYRDTGLLFFKACRQRLEAKVDIMVEWALNARDRDKRVAVLEYLLKGRLAYEFAKGLKSNLSNSWLEEIRKLGFLEQLGFFDSDDQNILTGRLGLSSPAPLTLPKSNPQTVLPAIYEWWDVEKDSYILGYEQKTYPDDIRAIDTREFDPESQEDRRRWLAILLLGSFHTMGRTIPGQHRNFLQLFWDKGWLQIFADHKRDPDRWIDILEQYLEVQVDKSEYYQWMKQYVSIYQLARWLSEYVESFLAVDRYKERFILDRILRLRASEHQQFGGLDAPPIARTLGIGACFVMRELVRQGILKSPYAYEHCYVPNRRVRALFHSLGCKLDDEHASVQDSRTIYQFLVEHLGEEKATFDLSFDLPFLTIHDNWGSIRTFMRYRDNR